VSAATEVKRREVEQIVKDAQAIIDQYKGGLPGEKRTQLAAMQATIKTKRAEIAAEEEEDALKAGFTEADNWLNKPQRSMAHGVNGDDDDKKKLERQGWEFKGGLAYAPTSGGKTFEMFEESVILGDILTDDHQFAEYQKTTRAAMSQEYKAAYCKFWRNLARSGGSEAMALQKMSPAEQKALSEGTDTAGGFTVPPDVQAELLMRTAQQAVMRRLARVQTTNRDLLRWPMLKANVSSGSIYSSAFVGSWSTETPAFSETDVAFQMLDIAIKKLRVVGKFSNDLLMDSAFNLLATLATDGAQNMALVEDNGLITGTGSANEPLGLLNGGFTTYDVEGTTANTITNTVSSSGSAAKIIAGTYLIPDQYVAGSVQLMSRTIEGKVAALTDGNGRPFWPANAGGGFDLPAHSIEGMTVYNSSFMPSDGTDANKVIFTGNISQAYIIAQRAQITSTVLRERFADTDQTGIVIFERVGGATWNVDAGRIGIV
jgi:HK97 family phage major capsid protein